MPHGSFAHRIISVLVLLAMLLSFAGQTIQAQAAPDTPLPFLDDFAGNAAPSGFVPFADSWDNAKCGDVLSPTTLVITYPDDNLPAMPVMDNTPIVHGVYDITATGSWGCGPGYAGVSRNFASMLDLSGYNDLRFWFKGSNSGNALRVEIKSRGPSGDASVRFEYGFTDDSSAWRYFSIPWTSFTLRNDYNPGRDAGLPTTLDLTQMWGYSILLPGGASGEFSLDEVSVTGYGNMVDFQGTPAIPAGFGSFEGGGAWAYMGTGTDDLPTIPAQNGTTVTAVSYNVAAGGWAGITYPYTASEDWSHFQGLSFWYKGGNNGAMRIELKSRGPNAGGSVLFVYPFTDNFTDWRYFTIPWSSFELRNDYNPGRDAGLPTTLDVSTIWGYSVLPPTSPDTTARTFSMDNIAPYGGGNDIIVPKAKFSASSYSVDEDAGTATITVSLSAATTVATSVDYATSDGTAIAGSDYTAAAGTLDFAAGETSKTFAVTVQGNSTYNAPKTINLTLSNPVDATLGIPDTATLIITDNDTPPDTKVVDDYTGSVGSATNPFGASVGFPTWFGAGSIVLSNPTIADTDPLALPGQTGNKSVLMVDYNIVDWGGFTHAFADGNDWVSQDWSRYDGVSFWLYGNNTGGTIQTEIFDNQQLGNTGDSAERWYYRITDNYTGWQFFRIPFSAFQRRSDWQPGGAPADGLTLTAVSGYAFGLPNGTGAKVAYLADYSLYGDLSAHGTVMQVQSAAYGYGANEGTPITVKVWLNEPVPTGQTVTVDYSITPDTAVPGINYTDTSGTLTFAAGESTKTVTVATINDGKIKATLIMDFNLSNPSGASLGWKNWATLGIINTNVPDPSMIDNFENGLPTPANLPTNPNGSVTFNWEEILSTSPEAVPGQFPANYVLSGDYTAGAKFDRMFGLSRNLTGYDALRFWYKGNNSGQTVKVKLYDGQPDPGPSGWSLAWSDEFDGANGDAPNAAYWNYNTGGHGWGNNEWEYYTDSRDNSALDGSGKLVITAKPNTDTSLECANGPAGIGNQTCAYTSARLLTNGKIDFAFGRIEARMKIPHGQGVWPAFWMLGSDFDSVGWPNSGEIDIMENIGKDSEVQRLYGTVHGPGYSGGSGIGSGPYETGVNLYEDFHTYAIEWEPTQIRWYLDNNPVPYFTVNASDVPAGKEWVFNKPFFIILNVAIGGNWPGNPDGSATFPQQMLVDYVRVYQGPDNAQRFESSFVDNSTDWQLVTLPYSGFIPSASQPAGAATNTSPVLTHVRGYGFELPSVDGSFKLDDVRGVLDVTAPDTAITAGPDASTSATTAEFTFNSPDNPTASFECSLDDATFADCSSPKTYTGLEFGPHTFRVRAKNANDNVDASPATHYWVIIGTFPDVPATHWAASFIERLFSAGVTGGCSVSPLAYCPESTATRAEMAVFLLRGIHGSAYVPPAATGTVFTDVSVSHWAAPWIEQLAAEGITTGCGGGNYCPEAPVTRAEMSIFLLRSKHGSTYIPTAATGTAFADVPASYWAAAWVEQLAVEGITGGCGNGNFCPNDPVTRAQMAVFLVRTFEMP